MTHTGARSVSSPARSGESTSMRGDRADNNNELTSSCSKEKVVLQFGEVRHRDHVEGRANELRDMNPDEGLVVIGLLSYKARVK